MKRIIFVDDEPLILSGMKRMLSGLRREWDMEFLSGAEEALIALANSPCDAIVSDIQMAGMDGVQLLTEVRDRHPDTVRIALSAHEDMEITLECLGATHQYLAKPCDADTVKVTIDRACALRDLLKDESLTALMTETAPLPALPVLYSEIMQAAGRGCPPAAIGEIISRNAAIAARVLDTANAAFAGRGKLDDPEQAVASLGLDAVRGLVLSAEIFSDLEQIAALDSERLWQHGARVGALAGLIARGENLSGKIVGLSQLAGLLHDAGKLVLASRYGARHSEVIALQLQKGRRGGQCEQQVFGHTHGEAGAYLLAAWGLPISIVEAVAFHEQPDRGAGDRFSPLTAVYLANKLAETVEQGADPGRTGFDMAYLSRLGIAPRRAWLEAARALAA